MEYTKGEWGITKCSVRTYGEPIQHIFITSDRGEFKGRTLADVGFWRDFPEEMVNANAQLIAAAPDLYEALKELMERFNGGTRFPLQSTCDKANEAIAKAEGG